MRVKTPIPLLLATGAKCAVGREAMSCSWHRAGPWSLFQGLGVGAEVELQKAESKFCLLMLLSSSFRKSLGLALKRSLSCTIACASQLPPNLEVSLHVTCNSLPSTCQEELCVCGEGEPTPILLCNQKPLLSLTLF